MASKPHRVLLTGATGFVGSHAAEAFVRAGYELRALVRSAERGRSLAGPGVELVTGTLEDEEALRRACADVDTVVHLAALTHARTARELTAVNEEGTARLIRAASDAGRPSRFIYLSSLAAVGPARDGRPVTRADAPQPLTDYGRSKLAGEHVCLDNAGAMEVVIPRAPAVYGPRDRELLRFFRLARYGILPVPTGAVRPLQMVHVTDLARALVRAVEAAGASGVYHIAEAQAYSWREVGRLVGEAVGRPVLNVPVPARAIPLLAALSEAAAGLFGRSTMFNRDKARELLAPGWLCETESARADLGYEAGIPLAEGLRSTAQWYREQGWL